MAEAGAPLVVESLRKLERGEITPVPQDPTQATFAPMLKKEDGRIDWSLTARQVYNRIRGLDPWPGAFTTFRGHLCHIWGRPAESDERSAGEPGIGPVPGAIVEANGEVYVVCGESTWLRLEAVHLEGRKRVTAQEFARGARLTQHERFGT